MQLQVQGPVHVEHLAILAHSRADMCATGTVHIKNVVPSMVLQWTAVIASNCQKHLYYSNLL